MGFNWILQPRALPSRIPKFRIPQFRILQPRTLPSRIPLLWIPQSRTRILQPRTLPSRIPQLWIPQSRTRILQLRTLPSRIPLHPRIVLHQKGIESDPWLKLHKKMRKKRIQMPPKSSSGEPQFISSGEEDNKSEQCGRKFMA